MLDDAVLRSVAIHRLQRTPKPMACSTSNKNGHRTVSNALATSSFNSILGLFFFRSMTAALWMYLKLSRIDLPRMKAFCSGDISVCIFGASRSAKIFEMSLAKLWIMVMGL
jgi:hypothetical protein